MLRMRGIVDEESGMSGRLMMEWETQEVVYSRRVLSCDLVLPPDCNKSTKAIVIEPARSQTYV